MENGWVEILFKGLPVDGRNETFISVRFFAVFHVNTLQQIHHPANSIICKHEKNHRKLFNLFNIANNDINSTFKLKRKLD